MDDRTLLGIGLATLLTLGAACDSGPSADAPIDPATRTVDTAMGPVRGYVMARWHDEIPHADPGECPDGLNPTEADYYPERWAVFMAERRRVRDAGGYLPWTSDLLPIDACQFDPDPPDPGFLTLDGPATVAGLDLDGIDSRRGDPAGAACAHDDFTGPDGAIGIDNQAWRLMGCIRGYRPNDLMDRLHQSNVQIKEGGYAILMEISGMDDPVDDDEVEVQLLSAAQPVTMNAVDGVLRHASLDAHADERYHNALARGRIENGILTTEPVDLRLKVKQQTSDNEFWFRDARIRAEVLPDGRVAGIVGAYWDAANFYSVLNDHWIGDRPQGRNAAFNRGFMCAGVYHAIPRMADGHPDPESGRCTSLSVAIHFEAVPAFVIRPRLASLD